MIRKQRFWKIRNPKAEILDLAQEIIREIAGRLVDLVDDDDGAYRRPGVPIGIPPAQQMRDVVALVRVEDGTSQRLEFDIVADVGTRRALDLGDLRVAESADGVVGIEEVARLRGRFGREEADPVDAHAAGDRVAKLRLAGTRLSRNQQRAAEADGDVDRRLEIFVEDVARALVTERVDPA